MGLWATWLYLLSGIAAALGQIAFSPDSVTQLSPHPAPSRAPLAPTSCCSPGQGRQCLLLPLFLLPFVVRAEIVLVVWFVMQFFTDANSGVALVAHVTGFVIGVLVTLVVKPHLVSTRRQAT